MSGFTRRLVMSFGRHIMSHVHSSNYLFDIELRGARYDCSFVLTDDRLITVTAAGRKHTEELGSMPPRALAIAIAAALIEDVTVRSAESSPDRNTAAEQTKRGFPSRWHRAV